MEAQLALYRRYRPETFAEMIGQDHVTEPLRNALANNRVNHAYLFSGPRGCGKTSCARILARAMNCERGPAAEPCGSCDSCIELARGGPGSIDVIEIDAASHGGVDDARDLREKAFFSPARSRYKVYIIDEAHMVTTQGFNALLKLVEEPPPHLKFVFATTEPDKVIGTIRSRTHHYPFRLVPPKVLSDYLTQVCATEGVPIAPAALPLVVRAGGGSVRDCLSVLDQLFSGAGPDGVDYEVAVALLGYTPDALLDGCVDAFAAADAGAVFTIIDQVIESGQDPKRFAEDLLHRLRDLVVVAAVPTATSSGLIEVAEDSAERLQSQAARLGAAELTRAADTVAAGLLEMRGATAPRLQLELICARLLLPGADDSAAGVHARLDRIERRLAIEAGGPTGPAAAGQPTEPVATGLPSTDTGGSPQPAAGPAAGPAATRPAPQPAEPERPPEPAAPAAGLPAPGSQSTGSAIGLADIRRLWPQILDEVKNRRRFAWIMLSQNAQVIGIDDSTLTIALVNAGARDSFARSGSEEILRQSMIDKIGVDRRVEAVVDPSTQPASADADAPVAPAIVQPPAGPYQSPDAPAPAAAGTGSADRPSAGTPPGGSPAADEAGFVASDDDQTLPADGTDHAELLRRALGATVIAEDDQV